MAPSTREKYLTTLEIEAHHYLVDPHIIDAIIYVESSWYPWACRFEKQFAYYWKTEQYAKFAQVTPETERQCQKMSWGLGQIMGGTARWLGFSGPLVSLCDPEINLHYVCAFYARLAKEYVNLPDQISAYNAGSIKKLPDGKYQNQKHVDKVLSTYLSLADEWSKSSDTKNVTLLGAIRDPAAS